MQELYAYPTRASRIKGIGAYVGWLTGIFLLGTVWIPYAQPHLNKGPCLALPWIRATFVLGTLLLAAPAALLARRAFLTVRNRAYPYPGAWTVVRTKVIRGGWAIVDGASCAVCSILLFGGLSYAWATIGLVIFCVSISCGC